MSISKFSKISTKQRTAIARILAVLIVVVLSVLIFVYRDLAKELARYGYLGIFLFSILANATVILPAPGILFVFAMGSVLNPYFVAIAAGAGAAIGELSGYLLGYSGQAVVEHRDTYGKILDWMQKNPSINYLLITFLAFIPNPVFDLAGIAAGTLRVPVPKFLFYTFIGKTLKMLLVAIAGAAALDWFFGA